MSSSFLDSDANDGKPSRGSLNRTVARLFEPSSDAEQTMPNPKRTKAQVHPFRPVSVHISTTPVKSTPVAGSSRSYDTVSSSSESEQKAVGAPRERPSKIKSAPQQKKRPRVIVDDDGHAVSDATVKGSRQRVKVKHMFRLHPTYVCLSRVLTSHFSVSNMGRLLLSQASMDQINVRVWMTFRSL